MSRLYFERPTRLVPSAPAGPRRASAEEIIRAYEKALGEAVEQVRSDNDAASTGARAIIRAYKKALGESE
jgi:hypothetical protein